MTTYKELFLIVIKQCEDDGGSAEYEPSLEALKEARKFIESRDNGLALDTILTGMSEDAASELTCALGDHYAYSHKAVDSVPEHCEMILAYAAMHCKELYDDLVNDNYMIKYGVL